MNKKAIVLFSGGLDSMLAAALLKAQGIEALGMCFVMEFASRDLESFKRHVKKSADEIGIKLSIVDISEEYLGLLIKPRFGFGSNINPCIDCKIFMLKKAKTYMEENGYAFVATGEVLGERPMSQNRQALDLIEKKSGLEGYLLRPLSAKLLEPTTPEKEGMVDRERLLDIRGRSRKPQFELAGKYGFKSYKTPAGGCLLTDPEFSNRVKDLMENNELTLENLRLLKIGRHFRVSPGTKIIVGRNHAENMRLLDLINRDKDVYLEVENAPSPVTVIRGNVGKDILDLAGRITSRYIKSKNMDSVPIRCYNFTQSRIFVRQADDEDIKSYRVG